MSSPDHQNEAGEQWQEGLPGSWEDCRPHPPLATDDAEDLDVLEHGNITLLRSRDRATCWIQAENDVVIDPEAVR